MKSIKNVREFAEAHGLTRQAVENRLNNGWSFGILDGNAVMYPPSVMLIKGYELREVIITHPEHDYSKRELQLIKVEKND
jgi:hypothetical protein